MRSQLLGLSTFDDIDKNLDGLKLLNVVKGIVYQFQSHKYLPHAIHASVRQFYMLQVGKYNTAAAYQEQFLNIVDDIDATGGSIGNHKEVLKAIAKEESIDIDTSPPEQMKAMKAVAKENYLAVVFILSADQSQYG